MDRSISVPVLKKLLICFFASSLLVGCNVSGEPDFELDDQPSLVQEETAPAPEEVPDPEDKVPDTISFSVLADVARDVQLISEVVTVSGINTNIPVVIAGGEYSVDGGEFTAVAGTISNNQTLQLRVQTPANYLESKTITISLGSLSVSLLVQTPAAPVMLSLSLLPTPEIRVGDRVVASSGCNHCDASKIRYEWSVEGIAQVVSTANFYQAPAEYALKEISVTATAINAVGDEGNSITQAFSLVLDDETPDVFSFTPLTDVVRDTQRLTEIITIAGINTNIPVVITGGEYSVDGGAFTAVAGTIGNHQTLQIRVKTPANYSESKTITINLGSLSASLIVQTPEAPVMLSISLRPTPEIRAGDKVVASIDCNHCDPLKTRYEWNVEGIAQVVSTENFYQVPAEYKLIEISVTAIAVNAAGDEGNSIIKVFSLAPDDDTPEAFSFTPLTNVDRDVQLVSEIVTITGINVEIPVVISGGEYSIDGGAFTTAAGTISNNQTLQLRIQTPLDLSESKSITISLGSYITSFFVHTPEVPKMLILYFLPGTELAVDKNLMVNSSCSHCDPTRTRYEWNVEGVVQSVSNNASYLIPIEHVLKKISITATAINTAGDEGSSITRTYGINRVKEIVGADGAFAALMFDGTVITWGGANSANNLAVASELTQVISIVANEDAFAAIKNDGTVVTWGENRKGGDSSTVADQLIGVQSIAANKGAFAAIKSDGTVITWGEYSSGSGGGDSSSVKDQLTSVQSISSADYSFAAIKTDGSVVTWGGDSVGGDSSSVADQLTDVRSIAGSSRAFAAVKADGSVVTWGNSSHGGDSSSVGEKLINVRSITGTNGAFAAIKTDGTVVTWGWATYGGDSRSVDSQLINIQSITENYGAFAALRADGAVVTWGYDSYGGDNDDVVDELTQVREVISTHSAFSAIKIDGSVVTWGSSGGDSSEVADQLTLVQAIYSTRAAFAAINGEGSIVTWGSSSYGANTRSMKDRLTQVKAISATRTAFAAIKEDGSVVAWGNFSNGANTDWVNDDLNQVQSISATERAFAALKADGSVVAWGDGATNVPDQLGPVQTIVGSQGVFAVIKTDSTVATWGNPSSGGNGNLEEGELTQVKSITGNYGALAAIKNDGSVFTWGSSSYGGDSSAVVPDLTSVVSISSTREAFVAVKEDGTVVTWGNDRYGADSSLVADKLTDVKSIAASNSAFAAIKIDGSVVTWGHSFGGSDSSSVTDQLNNVKSITGATSAFAAIKEDGTVVTWGDYRFGGDSNAVADQLTDVQSISATGVAFAALKIDGSVVTWGKAASGGDSSSVSGQLTQIKSITGSYGAFAAVKEDGSVVVWGSSGFGAYMQDTTGLQPETVTIP